MSKPLLDAVFRDALGVTDGWPREMREEAFHGIAGDFVAMVEPVTEADPHALLVQFLAAAGNAIGRGPGVMADGAFHAAVIWPVIVGKTAKARKGTSWSRVREPMSLACPDWVHRIQGGLATGEGLIYQVRDERRQRRKAKKDEAADEDGLVEDVVDAGVTDKRLCVVETEYASTFAVMRRDTNILSATLRNLWDHGAAGGMTKSEPSRTTRAHVTVIAHITLEELLSVISEVDVRNGLLNRHLFVASKRARSLPEGGFVPDAKLNELVAHLAPTIRGASEIQHPIGRTDDAKGLWASVYDGLVDEGERPGRLGPILSRAEPQVARLSLIYALLDGRDEVDVEHLRAALAVWDYSVASASYVFGDTTGNALSDRILAALRQTKGGMKRMEIRGLVGNKLTEEQIDTAVGLLQRQGFAWMTVEETAGRHAERWIATPTKEEQ